MGEKELQRAVPPNLLGPLRPKNHAWFLTQQAKASRPAQIHAEAIAKERGYVRDELGNFTVPAEVELRIIEEQRLAEPIAEITSYDEKGNINGVSYRHDTETAAQQFKQGEF